jgi:phosphoenolpyruvate synthase/pyruvate phosphate dikinase
MSIHHRSSGRIPLELDVKIRHKGKHMGSTFTRNITPYGAFIEFSATGLAADDFIEIHFLDKHKQITSLLQKGLIMHRNKEGVGVLFAHDKNEFRTMLERETAAVNGYEVQLS